jgi:hypothetical protein
MIVCVGFMRLVSICKPCESLQLGVIFSRFAPFRILHSILMMICESPSTTKLLNPCSLASCSPRINPQSSAKLFVEYPRYPTVIKRMCPRWSRKTAPYPAVPGLPLEAPSKLSFMKGIEGGDQEEGIKVWKKGGERVKGGKEGRGCQCWRIKSLEGMLPPVSSV